MTHSAAVTPRWQGEDVACIASGPSLHPDDVDYLRGRCRVIAINDNYRLAPWADVLYACDHKWWRWHHGVPDFAGERWTQTRAAAAEFGLHWIDGKNGEGLSTDPAMIHTGSNSGYQAINLGYLFGARRIILTGYDMKLAKNGAAHWFGDHPDKVRSNYARWLDGFRSVARQGLVEIVNCTRETALDAFPRQPLRDTL